MRVTSEVKQKTRERIEAAARKLFARNGFHETSTRDLAGEARIATGTLFNYFPSKESLALELVSADLIEAEASFEARRRGDESLAEDLFAYIVEGLHRLQPHRCYAAAVFETARSPFSAGDLSEAAAELREAHLEVVTRTLRNHGVDPAASFTTLHLYWTLYLGVLAYWARDESRHQEDTLVVLDQSLGLFVGALQQTSRTLQSNSNNKESGQ